jgi:hypothetical protein
MNGQDLDDIGQATVHDAIRCPDHFPNVRPIALWDDATGIRKGSELLCGRIEPFDHSMSVRCRLARDELTDGE